MADQTKIEGTAMTERELLERAAKAAGIKVVWYMALGLCLDDDGALFPKRWNPLEDDGDALRLVVRLKQLNKWAKPYTGAALDGWAADPYAATRRAIVRAAAEMAPA